MEPGPNARRIRQAAPPAVSSLRQEAGVMQRSRLTGASAITRDIARGARCRVPRPGANKPEINDLLVMALHIARRSRSAAPPVPPTHARHRQGGGRWSRPPPSRPSSWPEFEGAVCRFGAWSPYTISHERAGDDWIDDDRSKEPRQGGRRAAPWCRAHDCPLHRAPPRAGADPI